MNTTRYLASAFNYLNGELCCEQVPLKRIANEVGTPVYVYSADAISAQYQRIAKAMHFAPTTIAYALKANSNLHIIHLLAKQGAGADVVSQGELMRALKAGVPKERIVFSGVGKTRDELAFALEQNIASIHVESAAELDTLAEVCKTRNQQASIAFRVNPNVDPKTHPYISTGLHQSKFGVDLATAEQMLDVALKNPQIKLIGIATHIGSLLASSDSIRDATRIIASFALECQAKGAPIQYIDAGGGWPVRYGNETTAPQAPEDFAKAIEVGLNEANVSNLGWQVKVELGRVLVAEAGALLTRVVYNKAQTQRAFVVVDAAMNDLLRPALYQAHHAMWPVDESANESAQHKVDVVGPVCESGDFLAKDRNLPSLDEGALLAIGGAGAYCASMGSNYNSRPRPAEVLVSGANYRVVRARESYEDLWKAEGFAS